MSLRSHSCPLLLGLAFCMALVPQVQAQVTHDLCIPIDSSGSISTAEWQTLREEIAGVLENSNDLPQDGSVRLTVFRYDSGVDATHPTPMVINNQADADAAAAYVRGARQGRGGLTATHLAIQECVAQFDFTDPSVVQVIDLITDGLSNDPNETLAQRNAAIVAGLDVFNSIRVGPDANIPELETLAHPQPAGGNAGFVMQAPDFDQVAGFLSQELALELPVELMSFSIDE